MPRDLLQAAVSAGLSSGGDTYNSVTDSPTFGLRIGCVFAIWAAGFFGGVPPLTLRKLFAGQATGFVLRGLAGGIILALALIHIMPDAVGDLSQLSDYPIAGVCAVGGVLISLTIDTLLMSLFTSGTTGSRPGSTGTADDAAAAKDIESAPQPRGDSHTHTCMSASAAAQQLAATSLEEATATGQDKLLAAELVRQKAIAYTMEAGCIFHSVIIGLGLGVITDDTSLVIALLVALIFHQALEALALGNQIRVAQFGPFKGFLMLLAYSVTAPLGIAIGIGVSASFNDSSPSVLATQGALNGISAGLLLHISLIELIGEQLTRDDLNGRAGLKAAFYGAMICGAGCMALIAVWA